MTSMNIGVINDFKTKLRGTLLQPSDTGYDEARQIWNAMIDRRPGLIVRCRGTSDVRVAVRFAREHDIPVAVRGGGHNIAGNALCDDGMVIDLSGMRAVHVDREGKKAFVQGGATLGDFDHEAQSHGLATPLGINSTTGVGGLTLGGGFGWLSRKYGLTVDNLLSADIVTADGDLLRARAEQCSDLFWAIRGGGGNFGVATMFEFRLHEVGPEVTTGLIVFPFSQAKQVLTRYRDLVNGLSDDVSLWAVLRQAPPLPFLPPEVHGKEVVVIAFFSLLPLDAVNTELDAVRGFGQACGEHVGATPYVAWQQAFDPLLAPGSRNYWKSHNLDRLADEAIDALIRFVGELPTPECEIFLGHIGGQANRLPPEATAYPHRNVIYAMNVHTRWTDPADDDKCISWARAFFAATAPYAAGSVYINFLTQEEGDRIAEAYGGNYERLRQIKAKYDPRNLFRQNQNIMPA
ncbi:FAD-binding oxidoreductase [Noviherbaspirillum malthae]|uniref:FAD-binding oxidoreductase n=1 Tax=Noviherbaspirillum malthae TaxID=1260987 RepID=UPI0018904036|nr:FAD-binding oxidoreductase [Noviherbaspirillum malthae]